MKRRADRKLEIGRVIEETKQRLDEAGKQATIPYSPEENKQLAEARSLELSARIRALQKSVAPL